MRTEVVIKTPFDMKSHLMHANAAQALSRALSKEGRVGIPAEIVENSLTNFMYDNCKK